MKQRLYGAWLDAHYRQVASSEWWLCYHRATDRLNPLIRA